MSQIRAVAVFCGSQPGRLPAYLAAAEALGAGLAAAGIRLIFGGGQIGMMGGVADAVLAGGGAVTGVIPDFLTQREVAHPNASDMIVTDSMHTRKRRMFDLVDAFVTMPGGLGTLDETFEIITWRQLGLHNKPILLCDIAGSIRPIVAAMEATIAEGFARPDIRDLFEVVDGVPAVLARLATLSTAPGGESHRI